LTDLTELTIKEAARSLRLVTAMTDRSRLGSPWKRAAAGPIVDRTESTTTSGTPRPSGRSTTSATAPRATASGAKS